MRTYHIPCTLLVEVYEDDDDLVYPCLSIPETWEIKEAEVNGLPIMVEVKEVEMVVFNNGD